MSENKNYPHLKSKVGRPLDFTPDELLEACNSYFKWVVENPINEPTLHKLKCGKDMEEVKQVALPKLRPLTIGGLCIHLDICETSWYSYLERPQFVHITTRVKTIIKNNQLEGAIAGIYNPNIVARKLGLSDKQETTIKQPATIDEIEITTNEAPSH